MLIIVIIIQQLSLILLNHLIINSHSRILQISTIQIILFSIIKHFQQAPHLVIIIQLTMQI